MFNWESISGLEKLTKIPSLRILFLVIRLLQKKKKNITLSYVQIKKMSSKVYTNTFNRVNDGRNAMDFLVGYDSTFDVGRAYVRERWTKRNDRREKESVTKIDKHTHKHTSTHARTHTPMKIYPTDNCTRPQCPLPLSRYCFRVYNVRFVLFDGRTWLGNNDSRRGKEKRV